MKTIFVFVLLILLQGFSSPSLAETYINFEGGVAWQSRNDQRIPGDSGTKFSLSDFDTGPIPVYRLYVGHRWNERHELRGLYAPLAFHVDGSFSEPVDFQGETFAADTPTSAYYKFNSYRLTYAYHFQNEGPWQWALGFTAKVRDAEVRLEQPDRTRKKSNVGFVPLLNVQVSRSLSENWRLRADLDGLAAPQGRAFDLGLFAERTMGQARVYGGYRTVEGGADNSKVYNFAWFHYLTLGGIYSF